MLTPAFQIGDMVHAVIDSDMGAMDRGVWGPVEIRQILISPDKIQYKVWKPNTREPGRYISEEFLHRTELGARKAMLTVARHDAIEHLRRVSEQLESLSERESVAERTATGHEERRG